MVLDKVVVKDTTWKEFSKKNHKVNCVYYDVLNMMDTGQYKKVADVMDKVVVEMVTSIDLNTTARKEYYVRLDSRAASEVHGVKTLDIYNLVRETEVCYYRKDSWDQSKFEGQDHRVVTTIVQYKKSDFIPDFWQYRSKIEEPDHRKVTTMFQTGMSNRDDLWHYKSKFEDQDHRCRPRFEDNFVEKYKVGHCRLDYIAWDPGV